MRDRLPIVSVALLGAAIGWPRLPAAKPADAPDAEFSAARALTHIRAWSAEPRPSGSTFHAEVVASVAAELRALGMEAREETTGALTNVVASAPGDGEDGVWLVAHGDSARLAPGAGDDGLGLGVIVETVRALSVDGPPPRLHVLVTDGEERGLLGAKAYVRGAPAAARLAINVEARGTEGPAYMFQTAGSTPELLEAWREAGCTAQATSLARTVYELLPNDTDFTVLREAGWWGYDFALIGGAWRYHMPEDTADNLDPRSVQQMGDCVLGLARAWLQRPFEGDGGTRVYAQAARWTWVLPGWGVALLGIGPLALLPRPDHTVIRGLGALVLATMLAAVAGAGVLAGAVFAWPGYTEPRAEIASPEPLYLAAFGIGLLGCALARRLAPRGLDGAAVVLAAGAALASPVAGYILVPGAWGAALRLRGFPRVALIPAFFAGIALAPLYAAIFPALTSRALPVLAVLPVLTLTWLFSPGPPSR